MSNGVDFYHWGILRVPFPDGEIACWYCPLLDTDISKRPYCRRTGEYLTDPKSKVGLICPISFEEVSND